MRDSYEDYLLSQGLPIAVIPSEMTDDVRVIKATKDGTPYPMQEALREVRLKQSSQAYKQQLKKDRARHQGGFDIERVVYVLYLNNMRTLTISHASTGIVPGGKAVHWNNHDNSVVTRFQVSGITYEMLNRLMVKEVE